MNVYRVAAASLLVVGAFAVGNGMRTPHAPKKSASPTDVSTAGHPIARKEKLVVAFRLDPELTRGMYLGDRWVSPPSYYFAQQGTQFVVQAKAQNIDARGERVDLSGDWASADPGMVAVTHLKAGEVTIVVRHPGQSNLTVSMGDGSKVLHIRAKQVDDAMQVEITQ